MREETKFKWDITKEITKTPEKKGYCFTHNNWIEYRKKWEENPINNTLELLPLQLDLWASGVCNLKCPMCPRTLSSHKAEFMPSWIIDKVMDEIEIKGLYAFNLGGLGEPTLLPGFLRYIKRAKELGVVDVNIHTNGTNLAPEFNRKLIESRLDRIIISLDSADKETYEKIRVGANFERVYAGVEDLIEQKKKKGSSTPDIKLNIIDMSDYVLSNKWKSYSAGVNKFIDYWLPKVNRIAILPFVECDEGYERAKDYSNREFQDNFVCAWLWQRLSILYDGKAIVCFRDIILRNNIVGDIRNQSIEEIWHGKEMQALRNLHLERRYRDKEMCKYCPNAVDE